MMNFAVTMGSGSLAAMSMFEKDYKDDMEEEEAVALGTPRHSTIPTGRF